MLGVWNMVVFKLMLNRGGFCPIVQRWQNLGELRQIIDSVECRSDHLGD